MTRINVVPVTELTSLHLLAEYRELPRIFALVFKAHSSKSSWKQRQPEAYTLGRGHVLFFYDRLTWLAARQKELVHELQSRSYNLKFTECLAKQWRNRISKQYWQDYVPTDEAISLNWERIHERMEGKRWWIPELPFF